MDPVVMRIASSVASPLIRKLFQSEGPGAGLVDRPVRIASYVSFKGEKRTLDGTDMHDLAAALVDEAFRTGESPAPTDERWAVVDALTTTLYALGDLTLSDVAAVELGHTALARELRRAADTPERELSADATYFYERLLETACLHILNFFTQRSTFIPATLVTQSRRQGELIALIDELIARNPLPGSADAAFERRYLEHIAQKHNALTIYGIDLRDSPERWPLDAAYLSLSATCPDTRTMDASGVPLTPDPVRLHAEDAFLDHDRVLLRGDAGSGKTTLVQWLAITTDRDRIPFVLPLRTLIRSDTLPTPDRFLTSVACPHTPPDGWTERVLRSGRALVMVDGLDEIPGPDRTRIKDWLLDLTRAFPGNRWLVTSRPTAVRPDWLDGFRELTLARMTDTDVAAFVQRWHRAADACSYETDLLSALRAKPDLARLATNPLMCGLICALHRERRGYLPQDRKELYDAALAMLLTRRDLERGMSTPDGLEMSEPARLALLQRIAYALILSGRTEMDETTAESLIDRALPSITISSGTADAPAVFRHLLLRSGLLRQPGPGVVDFVHRTFLDYLGARAAVEDGHLDVLASHAADPQWEDVIRMAVAHARPHERVGLLEKLKTEADRTQTPATTGARLRLLAMACLEHATELDPRVRAEVEARAAELIPPRTVEEARALAEAGPLVLGLLPGPGGLSDEVAHYVTVTASMIATDAALPVLKRYCSHPDLRVRAQLVGTWHRFNTDVYADEVIAHLDPDDLSITIDSPERLRALDRMGPRPCVGLHGPHSIEDMTQVLDPSLITRLALSDNPNVNDLAWLTRLTGMTSLSLIDCPAVADLSPLEDLPLTSLHLYSLPELSGLKGLQILDGLKTLGFSELALPGNGLSALPASAPLEFLFLGRNTLTSSGLRGLGRWPTLQTLSIGPEPGPLTARDWEEVAALPSLQCLNLNSRMLAAVESARPFARVEQLFLPQFTGTEDLSALPALFPHVRTVTLIPLPGQSVDTGPYESLFPDAALTALPRTYGY
ncbi:NACHT domain-containing protein [Streptomyces beijiangensis]|uniref:NACHT domain-containing protein n=1 Tax=Streptomyces beijiangensis TaxID=163361 RepID=A0A939F5P7_9ACTN|nr:NACHT domain-containing protein [Streptomyces beijiangensis]